MYLLIVFIYHVLKNNEYSYMKEQMVSIVKNVHLTFNFAHPLPFFNVLSSYLAF
ncbi:hypothetical protein Hanom_Chr06g00520401 [Helianthus anomalus]